MEYSEKLIEFIDGELTEIEEKELFFAISVDSSLRDELKSLMNMNNSIKESADFYSPSQAVTASIYKDLNITLPPNNSVSNFNKTENNKPIIHFKSLLIGSLITAILLIPLLYFAFQNNAKSSNNLNSITYKSNEKYDNKIPSMEGKEIEKYSQNSNNKPIIKYIYIKEKNIDKDKNSNKTDFIDSNQIINDEITRIYPINKIDNSINTNSIKLNLKNEENYKVQNSMNKFSQFDFMSSGNNLGMSLEVCGLVNWNIPTEKINPYSFSKFNNTSISLFYEFLDNLYIGMDLRQETFYTVFQGIDTNKVLMKYEQQPNFTSYGLAFKYIPFEINRFKLYSQLNLDFNYYGLILRPKLGLEYTFYPDFSFVAGIEYGTMWFKHQGDWFNSSKYGINYGILYKF